MTTQAITTTYKGPTDSRGSRIIARCDARRLSVPYDHALDSGRNHDRAAQLLAEKLEWTGVWFGGGTGAGYVYVCVPAFTGDSSTAAFVIEAA